MRDEEARVREEIANEICRWRKCSYASFYHPQSTSCTSEGRELGRRAGVRTCWDDMLLLADRILKIKRRRNE